MYARNRTACHPRGLRGERMRSMKSKIAQTLLLVIVIAIAAIFNIAWADHGQSGSTTTTASGGNNGHGGNGGGDDGGGNGGGGNRGGGAGSGGGNGGGGNGGGGGGRALGSLKSVAIPVTDFSGYLNAGPDATNAAIALGKALFWDTQTGGDGQQACASCHFNAGADSRTKGQFSPGAALNWQVLGGGAAANYVPSAAEFPLHLLSDMANRNSQLMWDSANITGSQGLHHTKFVDVFPGSSVDIGTVITQDVAPDAYGVADAANPAVKVNTRRTTGKNAPSVINAVFNFRNFWDGRAQNIFNGATPGGAADTTAFVLAADPNSAQILAANGQPAHQIVAIANGALASQSVGPPNNATEMSFDGRDFKKLGKKMLSLKPLANQIVATNDSVLGPYGNQSLASGIPGLNISYEALIQTAFQPKWWNSNQLVDASGNFVPDGQGGIKSAPATDTSEFTLEEFNFSMFWGIAIQMYESTLVANDSRFDRYMDGDRTQLTSLEQQGLNIFTGKGHCSICHMGPELTDAAVGNQSSANVGRAGNPFAGFHMIGVRPVSDDKIIGGGAAKTPGLRNVDLTPPYFHNGGQLTLEQVVMFYARGGDFGTRGVDQDQEIEPRSFNASDVDALVAFLKSLTDERVANQSAPFDHPSIDLPNGAVGDNLSATQDGTGNALDDALLSIPAVGADGGAPIISFSASLQGTPLSVMPANGGGNGGGGGNSGGGNGGGNGGNGGGDDNQGGGDGGGASAGNPTATTPNPTPTTTASAPAPSANGTGGNGTGTTGATSAGVFTGVPVFLPTFTPVGSGPAPADAAAPTSATTTQIAGEGTPTTATQTLVLAIPQASAATTNNTASTETAPAADASSTAANQSDNTVDSAAAGNDTADDSATAPSANHAVQQNAGAAGDTQPSTAARVSSSAAPVGATASTTTTVRHTTKTTTSPAAAPASSSSANTAPSITNSSK